MNTNLNKMPEYERPSVTADVIITRQNNGIEEILLVERRDDPYKGCQALPGGFLDVGRESIEETCVRETYEETNLNININDFFRIINRIT